MGKSIRLVLPAVLVLVAAGAAWHGGWATITVEDLPDHLTAGQTVNLAFTVRQHGRELANGLNPIVNAQVAEREVEVRARAAGTGRYTAALTVPHTGDAAITIQTDFRGSRVKLVPIRTITSGTAPPALAPYETGRRLFVAKGCLVCHVHAAAPAEMGVPLGPDLTERRYPAAYLQQLLREPGATLKSANALAMPNLGLKAHEIDALTAFINAAR